MSKNLNLIIIVIMTLVFIFVPIIMKKVVWKKLLSQLDNEQYDEFYMTHCSWLHLPTMWDVER